MGARVIQCFKSYENIFEKQFSPQQEASEDLLESR